MHYILYNIPHSPQITPHVFTFRILKLIPCLSLYVRATCLPHQVAVYCDSATFIRVATTTAMRLVHRDRPNDGEASANSSHIPFRHLESGTQFADCFDVHLQL